MPAWREGTASTGPLRVRFLDVPVKLRSLDDPSAFADAVEASFDLTEEALDLLVIDTLSRCMAGSDENA